MCIRDRAWRDQSMACGAPPVLASVRPTTGPDSNRAENLSSASDPHRLAAVSYTHLTLPTTDLV